MAQNETKDGWVYSWVVPVDITVDTVKYHLIKVGKTEPHMLLKRLYDQQLGWSKILKKKSGEIKIPNCSSKIDAEAVDEFLKKSEPGQDSYTDLLFLMWRCEDDNRSASESERLMRSLLGPPFPSSAIKELIEGWSKDWKQPKPGIKKPAKPTCV